LDAGNVQAGQRDTNSERGHTMPRLLTLVLTVFAVAATLALPARLPAYAQPSPVHHLQGGTEIPPEAPADGAQTLLTFASLDYDTTTFSNGDTLSLHFNNPYQQASALLHLDVSTPPPIPESSSLDLQVSSPADDGYTSKGWDVFCQGEKVLRLGHHSVCGHCCVFARFDDLPNLHGATITNAYLEVYRHSGEGHASVIISAENAHSPQQIACSFDQRNRPRTSTSINWTGTLRYGWNRSPSITSIIQEIVDTGDPTAIQLFLDDDFITPGGNSWELLTWEYGAHNRSMRLHIDYQVDDQLPPPDTSRDRVEVFVNDSYLTTLTFNSPTVSPSVQVPPDILQPDSNTITLQFLGPCPKTLKADSTISITRGSTD